MILPHLILIATNLVNVWIDAYRIERLHKTIRHSINLAAYTIVICACVARWPLHFTFPLSAFFARQVWFDIPLNLRRHLKWDYVSLDKPPKAIMDQIEVRLFGYNGRLPTVLYGVAWIILLTIDLIWTR